MAAASAAKFFALGLPGSCSDDHLPIGAAWDRLFESAVDERAVPLLANAVDTGLVAATAEQERMLGAAHADLMASCVVLERAALELAEHYTRAGVEFRLLKGAAVAHLDYPDPSWRAFGDVDVLVTGAGYDAAIAVLEGLGGRRRSAEVRAGFDRRFGKGVCMLMPSGVQVDIHRTLATGPFGLTVDLDSLFSGSDSVTFGGRALPVLSCEHRFLHACFHAALGDAEPRLVALRDVAQMLLMTDLDANRARDTAQHWRAGIVVARAITGAWERFGLEPVEASRWAEGYRSSRVEQRWLAAYVGPDRSYARQMVAALPAIRGFGAKVAYVRALLVVDTTYARRHDGGYARRLRRAWSSRGSRERAM